MNHLFSNFSIRKITDYIKQHKYFLAICCIMAIAIFFRFYNYPNRWGLGSDQARDAIIVRRALLNHQFPLIGPFSASGQFVFGSSWYLIFMLLTAVYPVGVLTPWIMQSILFVAVVWLMIIIGQMVGGKKLAIITGLLTALSPAQLEASTNLIISSLENVISAGVLFCSIYVFKTHSKKAYFFLGLLMGLAVTTHFQAMPLLIILPLYILLTKANVKKILSMLAGFCIPFIPLIIFDFQSNFFESKNFISYLFFNNTPPPPGQRWKTYVLSFWSEMLGDVAGGFPIFGYINMACLIFVVTYACIKRKISKFMIGCISSFFIIFVFLRYFSGILFASFLSFLEPMMLLITAWMCTKIIAINKYVGYILCLIFFGGSIVASWNLITTATNNTATEAKELQIFLEQAYPKQKFAIYDYKYQNSAISLPLVLFIYAKNENKPSGRSIGIATQQLPNVRIVYEIKTPYHMYLYDLDTKRKDLKGQKDWVFVNPMAVYSSVEDWYKDN